MAMYDFAGRTALVTGAAGSGIGRATAHRLLDRGRIGGRDRRAPRPASMTVTADFQRAFGADG